MTEHKATPKQWEVVGLCQEEGKIPWATATCLLELRARVEALEAREARWTKKVNRLAGVARETSESLFTNTAAMAELRASIAEAQPFPAGSLVERVATAMQPGTFDYSIYEPEARAAIREVAAWLRSEYPRREGYGTAWANLIEEESNRG